MELLGIYRTKRNYLLPLVLVAAVLFISQGICLPIFPDPQEAKISNLQEAKPDTSVIAKSQVDSSRSRVVKTVQFFDLSSAVDTLENTAVRISVSHQEFHSATAVVNSAIPARAPPV